MPLYKNIVVSSATKIGIWKNTESENDLLAQLILSDDEKIFISSISNSERRHQWLCSRVCLRQLMSTNEFIELLTDENGKPFVKNFPTHVSISHTKEFAAVIISSENEVGIDIDKMLPRIERIAHKFMRVEEKINVTEENKLHALYLYWCAKEVLYKYYGRKLLDFREHLFVKTFSEKPQGEILGEIKKGEVNFSLKINYQTFDNHRLAWTEGKHVQ